MGWGFSENKSHLPGLTFPGGASVVVGAGAGPLRGGAGPPCLCLQPPFTFTGSRAHGSERLPAGRVTSGPLTAWRQVEAQVPPPRAGVPPSGRQRGERGWPPGTQAFGAQTRTPEGDRSGTTWGEDVWSRAASVWGSVTAFAPPSKRRHPTNPRPTGSSACSGPLPACGVHPEGRLRLLQVLPGLVGGGLWRGLS